MLTRLAVQGFGGVLAAAQRDLAERERWMSPDKRAMNREPGA